MLKTRQEMWDWLMGWVKSLPTHNNNLTPFAEFVSPLLQACVDARLNDYFRVGQSMLHIVFSTAQEHGLERLNPPRLRVTIRFDSEKKQWLIGRSYGNLHFANADREEPADSETAFTVLKSYLADLWRETRPGESLPELLAKTR